MDYFTSYIHNIDIIIQVKCVFVSGELIVAALFVAIAHFDLMGEHKAHDGQRNKGHNEAHRRRRTPIHAPH